MSAETILVTGASGFIGNYVVQSLLKNDRIVIATSSNQQKVTTKNWFSRVRYVPFDLEHFDPGTDYFSFFGSPDKVIHLAWEGLPQYKADFHLTINLPRHYAFLKNLALNGMKDLTVTGTCLEYGLQEGALREDMPAFPSNPYSKAKDELRSALEELQNSIAFSLKWVRLFYMYGRGQSANSLLSQLDKALEKGEAVFNMSAGEQVRDYLPVEEVAENIVSIALQNKVTGIINCGSGHPVSVKAFVENYLRVNNKQISLNLGYYPYPDYEPMAFWGDISKLKLIRE